MSVSSIGSNHLGVYEQREVYVVYTGEVVPDLQVAPPPPPLRSNRFCCLRVMDRVGSCLTNVCRKISRCFTVFLKGFANFFKTLYCHISSCRPMQIRNAQRTTPIEIPPQLDLNSDEIESLNQQVEPVLPYWLNDFGRASQEEQIILLEMSTPQDQIRVLRNLPLPEGVHVPRKFNCQFINEIAAIPVRDRCLSNDNQGCLFERTSVIHLISGVGQGVACPFTQRAWKVNSVAMHGALGFHGISGEFRIDHPLQQQILHWLKGVHGFGPLNPELVMNQFVERCINLRGRVVTEEIKQRYSAVWNVFSQYPSREEKLAWLNRLPQHIQIEFLNHNLNEDVERPNAFECPITKLIMIDPCRMACSSAPLEQAQGEQTPHHVFERSAIATWQLDHPNCPMDREPMNGVVLVPDDAMRALILNWLKEQHDIIPVNV